jgi:uncharacterized protein YjbI with pentapeptide repeats
MSYNNLRQRSSSGRKMTQKKRSEEGIMGSCHSAIWSLIGCAMLFWPLDRATGQDPMDHVDLTSDEMTKPELTREELLAILSSATPDERVDLTSKRLSGLDLRNVDFKGANLRWARLNNTDLRGANLRDTILDSAWLLGANLERADLRGASLASTQMRRANLRDANLSGARIVANLQRADLRGANLSNANMGADMKNQSMGLMRTVLRMAKLDGADMRNVNAMRLDAGYASMRGVLLDNANFRGADLTGADLTNASVTGLNLSGADVSGAYLVQLIGKEKIIGLDKVNNLTEAEVE